MLTFYIEDSLLKEKSPPIVYVIKNLVYRLGLRERVLVRRASQLKKGDEEIAIVYSPDEPADFNRKIFIKPHKDLWKKSSLPPEKLKFIDTERVKFPVIESLLDGEPLQIGGGGVRIGFDIIGSVYQVLGRLEEYEDFSPDSHGRFPARGSWLKETGSLKYPIVDYWIRALGSALEMNFSIKADYHLVPEAEGVFFLSFDIDHIRFFNLRRLLASPIIGFLREGGIKGALNYSRDALRFLFRMKPDPYWGFPLIEELRKNVGGGFSFFIIPEKRSDWEDYNLREDGELQSLLWKALKEEDEIGLHCTYDCVDELKKFSRQRKLLEGIFQRRVQGVRHHYLRTRVPSSWKSASGGGFLYDAGFGFADDTGFRAGTTFPFIPFDHQGGEEVGIIVIPLSAMDVTLRFYLRLDRRRARKELIKLIRRCKETGGVFSLLWHTSNLQGLGWEDWAVTLKEILEMAKEEGFTFLKGEEIAVKAEKRWKDAQSLLTIEEL